MSVDAMLPYKVSPWGLGVADTNVSLTMKLLITIILSAAATCIQLLAKLRIEG